MNTIKQLVDGILETTLLILFCLIFITPFGITIALLIWLGLWWPLSLFLGFVVTFAVTSWLERFADKAESAPTPSEPTKDQRPRLEVFYSRAADKALRRFENY